MEVFGVDVINLSILEDQITPVSIGVGLVVLKLKIGRRAVTYVDLGF